MLCITSPRLIDTKKVQALTPSPPFHLPFNPHPPPSAISLSSVSMSLCVVFGLRGVALF